MSDTDDIDDFLATLSTESAKAVPAKAVPKPKAVPPLSGGSPNLLGMVVASNDDDGDDIAAFLETTGLKADREVPDAAKPWMKYHKFTRVETIEEVNRIVNECIDRGTCSLDLETTGLDNRIIYKNGKPETVDQIVGFCISYDGYEGFYIPIRHKPADRGPSLNVEPVVEVERAITRLCRAAIPEGTAEDKVADSLSYKGVAQVVLFFWNAQFDHEFLYPVTGIDWWHPSSFEDGMLASFVKYAGDKGIGLKPKAKQLLIDPDGNPYEMIELKQLFQKGMPIRFDSLSPDEPGVIRYGGSDGICTYKLCTIPDLVPLCNAKYNFTYRLEKQLTCVLRVLERNRVRINRAPVRAMLEAKSKERDEILAKIRKFAKLKNTDLDPNSPKQLGEFLFGTGSNCMNITPKPAKNEASDQYKTDGATLEALAEEPNAPSILKDVVTYRGFEKSIGTYLIGLANNPDSNDELRVSFKQTGASTGRFSAPAGDPEHGYSGIPIHGIPQGSDLRRVFEARPGYTMAKCDYAGEELRIAANVSGETVWINEFMQGSGDLHTITARAFFGKQEVTKDERNAGKTANFALLYGGGPKSIIRATGCNEVEARRRKQAFDKAVPTFAKWIKQQHAAVKINLGVWTAFGRWLLIPDANSQEGEIRAACERHSVNFQIQGCLKYEARVLTNKGYIQIGELAKKNRPITVWTGTCWASAKAIDRGPCTLATIRLSDGTDIPCDTRHKLLVVTDEGYVWTDYKDLQPGMKIATSLCEPVEFESKPLPPIKNEHNVHNHKPIVVPKDVVALWYWLGRYMGDGWISEDGINYTFGTHERQAAENCAKFWATLGLNVTWKTTKHKPAGKEASRIKLDIYSENLVRWLASLGFKASTAHTKRVPERLFRESLVHRRAFIRGMMEADGCFHTKNKGMSYDIHLCQRPLLADFKLLFRTVGVESALRGPYRYTSKLTGDVSTSYRLDIPVRMYTQRMTNEQGFKFAPKAMNAPRFLVEELMRQDSGTWNRKAFPDESSYILYRRIVTGGVTTVYTIKKLCGMLGVELPSPIYGYKTLRSKDTLEEKEHTYTLSVDDPLHRFDALGVITKNSGADIMKIAMVLLHKAFHNKGWLRNGGDDSVRMLLTVHDEIVFEIKHERVVEVIPLIVEIMEGPWKRPKNPPWKVPLVVEPLVGFNWSSGYKVERHKKGQALGKGEVLANGYVYGTTRKPAKEYEQPDIGEIVLTPNKLFGLEHTPPWLASLVPSAEVIETPVIEAVQEPPTQEAVQEAVQGTIQTQEAVQEVQPQEAVQEPPTQDVPLESLSDLSEALLQVAEPQLTAPPEKLTQFPEPQTDGVIVFGIDRLNEQTAAQISDFVCIAMLEARRDGHGSILHLQDFGGETLIPISYNYRIQVSKFAELLRRHNLLVDK